MNEIIRITTETASGTISTFSASWYISGLQSDAELYDVVSRAYSRGEDKVIRVEIPVPTYRELKP